MNDYKVLPEWDRFITDDDPEDPSEPLDTSYSDVVEFFEYLIRELGKKDLIRAFCDNPEDAEERAQEYVMWHVNLMGLKELHGRYHKLAAIAEEVKRLRATGTRL